MGALFALLSSVIWGAADFLGGTVSRRARPVAVVAASQAASLLIVVPVVLLTGAYHANHGYVPWAVAAGLVGMVSLVAFYTALSIGTMGVVAPIAATGAVVPVAIGLIQGERPATIQLFGIGLAVGGVVLASGPEVRGVEKHEARGGVRALALALLSAIGFGLVLWLIAEGSKYDVAMTMLTQRTASVTVLLVLFAFTRSAGGLTRADSWQILLVGAGDVMANGLYALSTRSGLVSLVAVLGSLYPVTTVMLARVVHGERLRAIQNAGVATALLGVVLIGAGGL